MPRPEETLARNYSGMGELSLPLPATLSFPSRMAQTKPRCAQPQSSERTLDKVRDRDPSSIAGGCTTQPQEQSISTLHEGRGSSKKLSCREGVCLEWPQARHTGIVCGRSPGRTATETQSFSNCHPAEEVTSSHLLNKCPQLCLMNRTHAPFRGLYLH